MDFVDQNPINSCYNLEDLLNNEEHPFNCEYNLDRIEPVENCYLHSVSADAKPSLEVVTQPVKSFRFRYSSECAHGALGGTERKTYPTVKLHNFNAPNVFVRCSLWCDENDQPHPYSLQTSRKTLQIDPTICHLNKENVARFSNLTIVCVKKSKWTSEIRAKLKELLEEEGINSENELEHRVRLICDNFNPNKVRLRFDAFIHHPYGTRTYICKAFSNVISNTKCTKTSELKIERLSICSGSALGGDEMFLLVDKVDKKDIKVRFFELDELENEVWFAEAKILEIHHQYSIIIKIPPYKDVHLNRPVEVFLELFRPSDKTKSDKRNFKYLPARKRKAETLHFDSSSNDEVKHLLQNMDVEEKDIEAYFQLLEEQNLSFEDTA